MKNIEGRRRITTRPDYIVRLPDGRSKTAQFQFSTTERTKEGYDVKEGAAESMKKYDGFLTFAILPARKFFIIKNYQWLVDSCRKIYNPRWGGKSCYHIPTDIIPNLYDADSPLALDDII